MPFKAQINQSNIRYWITGGIILAFIFDIPELILQPVDEVQLEHNITGYKCAVSFKYSVFAEIFNAFLIFLFGTYAFSLLLIYLCIGRKMYVQLKSRQGSRSTDELSSKITKIAITVSVVFTLSYIPLLVLKLLVEVINQNCLNNTEFSIIKIIERSYAINHVANPFIFAFFDKRFRFHFKRLVSYPFRLIFGIQPALVRGSQNTELTIARSTNKEHNPEDTSP